MFTKALLLGAARFRRLIIVLVTVVAFFWVYNIFLVDHTLENLQFSLEQTAFAYNMEETDGLDILIAQAAIKEVSPKQIDSMNLADLNYSESTINIGGVYAKKDLVKTALADVIKSKNEKRGVLLVTLDRINRRLRKGIAYLALLPKRVFGARTVHAEIAADTAIFEDAKMLEMKGDLSGAINSYLEFIKRSPQDDRIPLAKLRLAYTYQKRGRYEEAVCLYREVSKAYYPSKEATIARALIFELKQNNGLLKKENALLIELSELQLAAIGQRQEKFYQLGIINTQLMRADEAVKFFNRAAEEDPASNLAIKARFNAAWVLKFKRSLEEAAEEFERIIKAKPDSNLVLDSRYQIADIFYKDAKFEEYIKICGEMFKDYKEMPIAPFLLFQIGGCYKYDLNDIKKGDEAFARLRSDYPDSIYSEYVQPKSPIALFINRAIPSATRLIALRTFGLFCLSGYSGEIAKFKAVALQSDLNTTFSSWLNMVFSGTIAGFPMGVDKISFNLADEVANVAGLMTMGRFSAAGRLDFTLRTEEGRLKINVRRASLTGIPIIPPMLINRAFEDIQRDYVPVLFSSVSIGKNRAVLEGVGAKEVLENIKEQVGDYLAMDSKIEPIQNVEEGSKTYEMFKKRFPWSDFSPVPKEDENSYFYDFFTRMFMYAAFKQMEAVVESRLGYRYILGRVDVSKENFRVKLTEEYINSELKTYLREELPWLLKKKLLFDITALKIDLKDKSFIFSGEVTVGAYSIRLNGSAAIDIDKKTRLPQFVIRDCYLNDKPFSAERLNSVTRAVHNILAEEHIPLEVEAVAINEDTVEITGRGARDYIDKNFANISLFAVYHIDTKAWYAFVEKLRKVRPDSDIYSWGEKE